jgi:hypothetical protein
MIPLDKKSNLEFSLSIENSTSDIDKATFFIENAGFDIALPIVLEDGKAKVKMPVLEGVMKPGQYEIRMELVLGGVLYTPFTDKLEFTAPVAIKVESAPPPEPAKAAGPSFSVKPVMTVVEEAPDDTYNPQFSELLAAFSKKPK